MAKKRKLKRDAVKMEFDPESGKLLIEIEWDESPIPVKNTIVRRLPLSEDIITALWDRMNEKQRRDSCLFQRVSASFVESHWDDLDATDRVRCIKNKRITPNFVVNNWKSFPLGIRLQSLTWITDLPIEFIMQTWAEMEGREKIACWVQQRLFYRLTVEQLPAFLVEGIPRIREEAASRVSWLKQESGSIANV